MALLPVASARALAAGDLPDLRDERPREGLVVLQQIVEPGDQIANRTRGLLDALRHQRPQPEAARMILHPAGLERRVLAVVAEHEQARAFGVMHHVLGQDVHVGNRDRPHGSGRLAIPPAQAVTRGPARQTARQGAGVRAGAALSNCMQLNGGARRAARPAPGHGTGMRRPALAAEVEGRGARVRNGFSVIVARADQAIEQHHALAAVRLFQGRPPMTSGAGLAPARLLAGEDEVLEKRDVVVLPARGACHHRKVRMVLVEFAATGLVFRGKPQAGAVRGLRKRHYRPADAAHEPMHDRAQQRASFPARGGSERQPGKDLGFRDRSACLLLEHRRKFIQCTRRSQLLVQAEDELVAGERRVQRVRPVAFVQIVSAERAIGRTHCGPGIVVVLHRLDAALEDAGGFFERSRRNEARRRLPHLGLVVFPDRHHRFGWDAEEPRCEVVRGPRTFAIDDGGRGGDTCRMGFARHAPNSLGFAWLMPSPLDSARCESGSRAAFATAEGAQAPDEAGRLRAQRARECVRLVEDQVVEPRAGEQLDVLLPGQEQFELLDVGEQDAWLPAGCAHDLPGADLLARIDVSPLPSRRARASRAS